MTKADHIPTPPSLAASNVITFAPRRKAALPSPLDTSSPKLGVIWEKRLRPDRPEPETETGRNARLRQKRRHDWWVADARRAYWKAAREMEGAVSHAQTAGLPEGQLHPGLVPLGCWTMVAKYREAIMAQLLTPAPTMREIEWKRATFKACDHEYTDIKPERIERAIAEDVAWLAAHPTRRTNSEAMARSRKFKEAMRQRIREVAASRDLSDEEIKPALTLKHQEIARFSEQHGVSIHWLLEGRGPPAPQSEPYRGRCELMDILDGA